MPAQASSYQDHANAVLGGAQSRGEYLGSHYIPVGEEGYTVHVGEANSDEERGGSKLLSVMMMRLFSYLHRPGPRSLLCSAPFLVNYCT